MRISTAAGVAGVSTAALALSMMSGPSTAAESYPRTTVKNAIGLTASGTLVAFELNTPQKVKALGKVTGLSGDTALVGIDYRVQDRKLYGVGDQGGVYTIAGVEATKVSQLSVALSGTSFGVDFNPAADRLRVVSDTGQNLRHDVTGGTTTNDGTLNYPAPPAPATPAAGISAAAYTNNDLDTDTATSLFDLDTAMDQVVLQSPANSGQLAATGKLRVDAGAAAGFDIHNELVKGEATENKGFATLSVGGKYTLYKIDLLSGQAFLKGAFPSAYQVGDLAIALAK